MNKTTFVLILFALLFSPLSRVYVQENKKPLWPNLANELWKINKGSYNKWPPNSAGEYFGSTAYTYEEYEDFWRHFLAQTPQITWGIRSYVSYALYYWFSPEARKNSSAGSCIPALEMIENFTEKGPAEMSRILLEHHKQDLQNFDLYFYLVSSCVRAAAENQNIHLRNVVVPRLRALVKKHDFLSPVAQNDKKKFPLLNTYRSAIYNIMAEAERENPELAKELGFPAPHENIWRKYRVIISDNNGLMPRAFEIIDGIFHHIPTDMHQLRLITVLEYLDDYRGTYAPYRMINIFKKNEGIHTENGFLKDVPPHHSDQFAIVVVHEINHNVDASWIDSQKQLSDKKKEIIKRAGRRSANYIRDLGDGFFENSPQEFFASISNIYFANTIRTLDLGQERCRKGFRTAMEHALFFVEVYSRGGDAAPTFVLDEHGTLTRGKDLKLKRNKDGDIVEVQAPNKKFFFTWSHGKLATCMSL
ncbi:MAG: hypothetical protein NZM25_10200 [Leptospiraceae bacterium]|nr:hypothetical protein [Leptospiraceae bacterium]